MRCAAAILLLLALVAAARAGHYGHHHHGSYGHHHHHGYGGYYSGQCHGRGCKHPSPAPHHGHASPAPHHNHEHPSHTGFRCGTEIAALELAYEEFDSTVFQAGIGSFSSGLSDITNVRLRCMEAQRDGSARRRSLLADAPILVTFTLKSDDATAVAQALAAAALDGTLDPELLALLGGQLSGCAIIDGQGRTVYSKIRSVTTRSIESPAPAPSAESPAGAPAVEQLDPIPATLQSMPWAEAPSQAPADGTTVNTASTNTPAPKKKKSNLGAILGGAIGGGVGGLAVLAAAAYFLMRKKGSPSSSFAVGNPTFAPQSGSAGATVTLAAPKGAPAKAGLELEEVIEQTGTPRSARRRVATPFQDGEGTS